MYIYVDQIPWFGLVVIPFFFFVFLFTRIPIQLFKRVPIFLIWIFYRHLKPRVAMKFLPLLTAAIAAARQAADLNVTKAEAEAYSCGDRCQKALAIGIAMDLAAVGKDFDFDFYETASNFSTHLKPGEILKVQPLDPDTVNIKSGTTAYRIQYTSLDYNGLVVPVTGFIAFPQYPIHGDRYRLVTFAHGTIGLFAPCAPSNGPTLYDYDTWTSLVDRGYAVVATDYAGLGNSYTSHKYLFLPAHANDVYFAQVAARKIFGDSLTEKWMSAGHSQGGGAVWKLAESKYVKHDHDYLGTVALAPVSYVVDMFLGNKDGIEFSSYAPYVPIAVESVTPGYTEIFLTDIVRKRVDLATKKQLCIDGMLSLPVDLTRDQLVNMTALDATRPILEHWQKRLAPAQGDSSPAPIFIVQGTNDTSVLAGTTLRAWQNSCGYGNSIHMRIYEEMEHAPSVAASVPEWLTFVDSRFGSRSNDRTTTDFDAKCTLHTRRPFNRKYVKAPDVYDLRKFLTV